MVRRREHRTDEYPVSGEKSFQWVKWIFGLVILLVIGGLGIKEWQASQIVGHPSHRFNLALIAPGTGVTFVSFDPTEKAILALPFPSDLSIQSRNSGEYSITSLYKLGSYTGEGGMFARQKIQGFMRVPIPGYLVVPGQKNSDPKSELIKGLWQALFSLKKADTSLSRFDAMILLSRVTKYSWRSVSEDELVRAAVIEKKDGHSLYHPERLQVFVGTRLFDWGIGSEGVTVAIVNASGENGLGSDMADFLTNLGLDVVMVRSATESPTQKTTWAITSDPHLLELRDLFPSLFGWGKPKIGVDSQYRAEVVILVGQDAKDLF